MAYFQTSCIVRIRLPLFGNEGKGTRSVGEEVACCVGDIAVAERNVLEEVALADGSSFIQRLNQNIVVGVRICHDSIDVADDSAVLLRAGDIDSAYAVELIVCAGVDVPFVIYT